ncbi:oxygen-independent coproporphyrinogen-3 oxidase [Parelusimicrobium proximum]|uniref:radical SAM family heme chaperone HemW n=1 Tax=Parelusimicrobium proximum TaxID=3228953 RepID=UPI003D165CA2
MTGLYIHIPFCEKKCNYCSFVSFPSDKNTREKYIDALCSEINLRARACDSLYIGGGTPSVLEADLLDKLFACVEKSCGAVSDFKESTFEANPESLTQDKINILKKYGVNRVSLGLQSFDNDLLKNLGRIHTKEKFLEVYGNLRASGFNNINVDLIASVPGQSGGMFRDGLNEIVRLSPEHISVYGLQIEEGTKFYEDGVLQDQNLMRSVLEDCRYILTSAGYHHYEISNFAKRSCESMHNLNYWQNGEYTGCGLAAASYLSGVRSQNTDNMADYLASPLKTVFEEKLEGKEKLGESIMIGLRMLDGIEYTGDIKRYFAQDVERLKAEKLLAEEKGKIKLTEEGIYLANEVMEAFVPPY